MTVVDLEILPKERRVPMSEAQFFSELDGVFAEWVDGEAIIMSPVSLRHSHLVGFLAAFARMCAEHASAGEVFIEPVVCRVSPTKLRSPDVCFVSAARASLLAENEIGGAPDLVMEVVSPDSRRRDYRTKFAEYEAAGVTEYWIFDPVYETVDAHGLANGAYSDIAPSETGTLASAVLPKFHFDAAWLKPGKLPNLASLIKAL